MTDTPKATDGSTAAGRMPGSMQSDAATRGGSPAAPGAGGVPSVSPFSPRPAAGLPWYRRRNALIALVVAAVAAVTVVADLPQHASRAVKIGEDNSVMKEVNAYNKSCAYAVTEAFSFYRDETTHSLTPSQAARVPSLLRDDQLACSFTNQEIFNLSNVEAPGSADGRDLQRLVGTVTTWSTSDALASIEVIQALTAHPSDAKAKAALVKEEKLLETDRKIALSQLGAAEQAVNGRLVSLQLPSLPHP